MSILNPNVSNCSRRVVSSIGSIFVLYFAQRISRQLVVKLLKLQNVTLCHGFWNGKNTAESLAPICKQAQGFMISSKSSNFEDPVTQIFEKI